MEKEENIRESGKKNVSTTEFDSKAENLVGKFERLAEVLGSQEKSLVTSEIDSLKESGARPYKVFVRIAGECSRADNIFCGINGETSHQVLEGYLREQAESVEGEIKDVLCWLALREERLANHRGLVKDFLILDQLTDGSNYQEGRVVDENTPFFNSSLSWHGEPDITSRVLPATIKAAWTDKVASSQQLIREWEQERQLVASVGLEIADYIIPNNQAHSREVAERGSSQEDTRHWLADIQKPSQWLGPASEMLEKSDIQPKEIGPILTNFMEGITAAEAVLEHQQYFVGVGLLRATASGNLPSKVRETIKEDLRTSVGKG